MVVLEIITSTFAFKQCHNEEGPHLERNENRKMEYDGCGNQFTL